MTVIVPKIRPSPEIKPEQSEPSNEITQNDNKDVYKSSFKNISSSLSLVISKKTDSAVKPLDSSTLPGLNSDVKVITHGRRRSVDKQYRPSQPTGNNNGGGRTSQRRSGRSYQNYDNNSSNGNSGADGNGEDNDDSDDDSDEYINEDDDDEDDEEDDDDDEDEDKNDDDDDYDDKNVNNTIDDKVLASFGLKVPSDSTVNLEDGVSNGPIPAGTPITLQGIVCHETLGGVLVVNIKWRNKIYCGSLMDCTRHSWARPRFQSNESGSHPGKSRLGKNNDHGKGKGKGKRLRSNSVTSNTGHTVSPLKQKLRGRKKTISGSSVEKRQGFRSSKRKPKNDEDSDDSTRPGKRTCTGKGGPSPTPSPTLIPCPEPGCEKKYKHINGLRYHQAHAHLESKNQEEDNNSDERSSTTPSPSEEFKEPDPLVKNKASLINTQSEPSYNTINENSKPASSQMDSTSNSSEENQSKQISDSLIDNDTNKDKLNTDCSSKDIKNNEDQSQDHEKSETKSKFVEVTDKSTDTCIVSTSSPPEHHSVIAIAPVLEPSEVPEIADTQEVWETVLDSGCVSGMPKVESKSKQETSTKAEGQQVLITSGINQLGIEVEDISENEDDIDPGQDIEFNSREEMEKAVENLQSGSFVASMSTENNLQILSSLKDPSLMFGLTNRERLIEDKESNANETEHADKKPDITNDNSVISCTISVETLVSRSITASKHEPPLTNADTPSSRFKYFPCRSYGDESYSISNINSNATTLALIRHPELIKNDITTEAIPNANTGMESSVESTKPSYTGSSGFNQDCTTSSIHTHGPKEELKDTHVIGDIVKSHATCTQYSTTTQKSSNYTSPKSSTTTTFNTKLYTDIPHVKSDAKRIDESIDAEECSSSKDPGKSPVMFMRQPSTLIPKHSRPSMPSLPVGVAYPYQYTSTVTHTGPSSSSHDRENEGAKSEEDEIRMRPVGEVGPVNVKRPAIHAGLPSVIPVGVPGLKTQSSLRQGHKHQSFEERASTPTSMRLSASSPRYSTNSPIPTSPRLTDSKSTKHSSPKPSNSMTDVVQVKQESESSKANIESDKKTIVYDEHLTPEQIQFYQYHQMHRQMLFAQASMDPILARAYFRENMRYENHLQAEQYAKLMQQQRLRAAEEERMELQASKRTKEESNKFDKSESSTSSTPPRFDRTMKDLSPGEGSRSSTSSSEPSNRGPACLDKPPEKKAKIDKRDDTDHELKKLQHKRQEEYLSKQSMQHKFTMLKQLENAGGAAKTHSLPLMVDSKDQKTKAYSSTSTEPSSQSLDKMRKAPSETQDETNQSDLSSRSRDPSREGQSKSKRLYDRVPFIPSQFQDYLKHDQLPDRYEHSQSGSSLLIPGHVDSSYVSSRINNSPYKSSSPSLARSPRSSPYKIDTSSQSLSPHRVPRPLYTDVHTSSYSPSTSRSSVFSRADKPKSPPIQSERHKSDVYSSSRLSEQAKSSGSDSPKHGGFRGGKEETVRQGIISKNLAVRRGDVTSSMVLPGHGPSEEELIRHQYMVYPPYRGMLDHRQQQHAEQVYAMMSSAQQSASRSDQYYNKR